MKILFNPDTYADNNSGPLYLQFHRRIVEAIADGRLKAGDHLPPERDMAAQTGMSRVTIRKGIEALVASGQLVQRRGSGTFVAHKVERIEQALSLLTSFTEDMARRGKGVQNHWLSRDVHAPTPAEVMALGLGANDRVSRLERVRSTDGVPLAIERASLPTRILPDPQKVETSLYAVLELRGKRPVRAVQRISATTITAKDAELLGVMPGVAGLRIERISYLENGQVVEFTRSTYRGDAYDFSVELTTPPKPVKDGA